MRQRITAENLKELSLEQQEKLRKWWHPEEGDHFLFLMGYEGTVKSYNSNNDKIEDYVDPTCGDYLEYDEWEKGRCLPLLSIGQCLELLDHLTQEPSRENEKLRLIINRTVMWIGNSRLIDEFWHEIREIL